MSRVDSHAALMDRIYRNQRYLYDFTRKYYLFGRDKLIEQLHLQPGARIVEVGCGTARNLVQIAKKYPTAKLYGLDASAKMLATASQSVAQAGLSGRVKLVKAYAEDLSPGLFGETEPFDAVIFSYSLSMISDWKQVVRTSIAALAPEGRLHIVDFGDFENLVWPIGPLLRAWLGLFHVRPREDLLKTLEKHLDSHGGLALLSGRYAFLLSCGRKDAMASPLWSVA